MLKDFFNKAIEHVINKIESKFPDVIVTHVGTRDGIEEFECSNLQDKYLKEFVYFVADLNREIHRNYGIYIDILSIL